jgi:hypothetical protein
MIVVPMEPQSSEQMPHKNSVYNREQYDQNKEEMLKYRRERYRTGIFCLYNIIFYVIIGKQKCIQCDELKNLLDEKGIKYNYLDMTEMPNKTMTYLRMYCNSFPIVLT